MRNSLKIQFGKIPRNWQIKQVLIFLYQMLAEEQVYQEDLGRKGSDYASCIQIVESNIILPSC